MTLLFLICAKIFRYCKEINKQSIGGKKTSSLDRQADEFYKMVSSF